MNPKILEAMRDELEKIGGKMPALMSMGGLAGLTAVEGAGAFNKKHSKKERLKDGASAAFTGSILAGEAIHNKDMLKGGLRTAGKFLKRASVKEAELIDRLPEPVAMKLEDVGNYLRKNPHAIKKALKVGAGVGVVGGAAYLALKKGKKKEAGVSKGLKHLAESTFDTAKPLSNAQEFARLRYSAHLAGKEGRIARRAGQQLKSEALSAKKPLERTDLTSINRKVNLRGNGFRVGELDSDRNYSKFHKSKKLAKHAEVVKEASTTSMSSMMKMHRMADAAKAAKGSTGAAAQAAPKLTRSAPREFDASHFGPSSGEKIELARQPNKAQGVMNRINKHFKGA